MTSIEVLFACVPVTDLDGAVAWYTRLFGRPVDIVPNDDEVMWRLADPAWLYVLRDPKRAGQTVVTLCVADLDEAVAGIAARGITGGPVQIIGDHARKVTFTDADGNAISVIEVTGS
jgi:catechol 2,3-dioxygenase-like lactoylglutathione lyase family enzyme